MKLDLYCFRAVCANLFTPAWVNVDLSDLLSSNCTYWKNANNSLSYGAFENVPS